MSYGAWCATTTIRKTSRRRGSGRRSPPFRRSPASSVTPRRAASRCWSGPMTRWRGGPSTRRAIPGTFTPAFSSVTLPAVCSARPCYGTAAVPRSRCCYLRWACMAGSSARKGQRRSSSQSRLGGQEFWSVELEAASRHFDLFGGDPPGYYYVGGSPRILVEEGVPAGSPLTAPRAAS